MKPRFIPFILLVLLVASCLPAAAQTFTIYDNTSNYLGLRTGVQNAEIGDIVTFARSERFVKEFSFDYYLSSGNGNETAQVFFRDVIEVDGNLTPYNLLLGYAPRSLEAGFNTMLFTEVNFLFPDTVAWTVRFAGFEGAEEGGLLFSNPPAVGSSPTQGGVAVMLQETAPGVYANVDTPGVIDNLAARFVAVPEVPAFNLISSLVLLAMLVFRRTQLARA